MRHLHDATILIEAHSLRHSLVIPRASQAGRLVDTQNNRHLHTDPQLPTAGALRNWQNFEKNATDSLGPYMTQTVGNSSTKKTWEIKCGKNFRLARAHFDVLYWMSCKDAG